MRQTCLLPITTTTALLIALLASSCGGEGNRVGRAGIAPELEGYIPADTVILFGARVDQIRTTPLYERLVKEKKIAALDDFARRTGLDPRKDLQEFLIASNGKEALMMAKGRIENSIALEELLVKDGAMRQAFDGHTLLTGDSGQSVVFVANRLALAGSTELLKKALAKSEGEAVEDTNRRAVLARVGLLPKDRHMWVVAVGGWAPMPLPETGNLANLNRVFQSLESVTMTMSLSDGVSLNAAGTCNDERGAKQLHDMLRGLIGFGRLSTPSDRPEMLRFFDGVQVDHSKKEVKVDATVPKDLVDVFLQATGRRKPV
jgi:hypothetical protein